MATNRVSSESRDIEQVPHEKDPAVHNEYSRGGLSQGEIDFVSNFPEERKKKILSKVDWRLVPMLVLLYLVAYLDKTNIGNAKIEGMTVDLNLHGIQYNVVVAIFFIPFVLCGMLPLSMAMLVVLVLTICRGTFKHDPAQGPQAFVVYWRSRFLLGDNNDSHWPCSKLCWSACHPFPPRYFRVSHPPTSRYHTLRP